MSDGRGKIFWAVVLFGAALVAGVVWVRPGGAQSKTQEPVAGRYKIHDIPVGKFIYRLLFDTTTADFWAWSNGEWESPEPPAGGLPWKNLKPLPGRFQLLPQVPGELDGEMYVLDTSTGRMWARSVRNRVALLTAQPWREIELPPPPRR